MTRTYFNDLVASISTRLYNQAYRILREKESSEDAVQEVFLKLWKMHEDLDKYNSVEALASTMVKNYCIDQIRKLRYHEKGKNDSLSLIEDLALSPADELEQNESGFILDRIVEGLPEGYRDLLRLREIEELEYDEIVKKTGLNINTLRVNLSRARKLVREKYKRYFNE